MAVLNSGTAPGFFYIVVNDDCLAPISVKIRYHRYHHHNRGNCHHHNHHRGSLSAIFHPERNSYTLKAALVETIDNVSCVRLFVFMYVCVFDLQFSSVFLFPPQPSSLRPFRTEKYLAE